jgi:hypothetical protein
VSWMPRASNQSDAKPQCFFVGRFCLSIVSLLYSSGCDLSPATESMTKTEIDWKPIEIDVGVIFNERTSYICIPVSWLGEENGADIVDVTSSCECIRPTLVRYKAIGGETTAGVQCEFIPDDHTDAAIDQSMALAISITCHFSDGTNQVITINFVSTQVAFTRTPQKGSTIERGVQR